MSGPPACILMGVVLLSVSGCDELGQKIRHARIDLRRDQISDERLVKIEQRVTALEKQNKSLLGSRALSADDILNQVDQEQSFSYDRCLLRNLKRATSDVAAQAIKAACIRSASVPLPDLTGLEKAQAAFGRMYEYGAPVWGLYVTLNNSTGYTITELTITIVDKTHKSRHVYTVREFMEPEFQPIMEGPPSDRTLLMQIPPGMSKFAVELAEHPADRGKFFEQYEWAITSAKGFLD